MPRKAIGLGMKDLLKMTFDEESGPNQKKEGKTKKKKVKQDYKELLKKIKNLEEKLRNKEKSLIDKKKLYKDAISKVKNNEFYESLKLFNVLIYFEPENIKCLNNTAVVLYNLGLKNESVKILKRILELEPYNKIVKDNLEVLLNEE